MKRRESVIFLAVGLVVGLVLGMALAANNDSVNDMFGSAVTKETDVNYYLVKLEDAQTWLAEEYPENSEQVKASFDVLAKLPVGAMPNADAVAFPDAEKDIEYILPQAYGVLVGEKGTEKPEVESDDETSACLGVDDDPYVGATLYLYLTIPAEKADKMDISKDWQELKDPKTNVLYWKLLACYPDQEEKE